MIVVINLLIKKAVSSHLSRIPGRTEPTRPNADAFKVLVELPRELRPLRLTAAYPRVMNEIAIRWHQPVSCERYLSTLIYDCRRPHRQGFPVAIGTEILKLYRYYSALHKLEHPEEKSQDFVFG